jgi:TonB family protein
MKFASTHVRVLIAATLLSVCPPIVAGQTSSQTPPKVQIGTSLTILSPTRGADFSRYGSDVLVSIKRNLIASLPDSVKAGQAGLVSVIVQVRPDGTFLNPDPKIVRSSNRDVLDATSVAAVRASGPFPHLPSGFDGATVELKISFYYNIPTKLNPTPEPAKPDAGAEPPK